LGRVNLFPITGGRFPAIEGLIMKTERPDYQLAIGYAQRGRAGIAALFALDDRLAGIVRRASDPLVGQMRLTWWREALEALGHTPPPAEPILQAIADDVVPAGVDPSTLAGMTDGWEALLEEPFSDEAIVRHGVRGAALFEALATVTGAADDDIADAGRGWALADLAVHLTDPGQRDHAAALARPFLQHVLDHRWSRAGRMLGALTLMAQMDLDGTAPTIRVARLLRLRLTGR